MANGSIIDRLRGSSESLPADERRQFRRARESAIIDRARAEAEERAQRQAREEFEEEFTEQVLEKEQEIQRQRLREERLRSEGPPVIGRARAALSRARRKTPDLGVDLGFAPTAGGGGGGGGSAGGASSSTADPIGGMVGGGGSSSSSGGGGGGQGRAREITLNFDIDGPVTISGGGKRNGGGGSGSGPDVGQFALGGSSGGGGGEMPSVFGPRSGGKKRTKSDRIF